MKASYPAGRDRGHGTKNGAQALLLTGCGVKFPGVPVPQVAEVEACAVALTTKNWKGTAVAAGAAGTVDCGDVTGLVRRCWHYHVPVVGLGDLQGHWSGRTR